MICIGAERFQAPECLFHPELANVEGEGIANVVFDCCQGMDVDNRLELYNNIVLSGGSTLFPGLPCRLEKEVTSLYTRRIVRAGACNATRLKVRVEDPPKREHLTFLGGAVLADVMRSQNDFWVTREEYYESGVSRCLQKCGSL